MDADARRAIDEIKARHPIQDVATRYTDLRKTGAYLVGRCPFHDDLHPSFGVHVATGTWRCWSACDVGGDVIDLVGCARYRTAWNSHDPAMFKEALRLLDGNLPPLRHPIPEGWNNPAAWRLIELEPGVQIVLGLAARLYHTTLLMMGQGPGTPYAYLRARGLDDATVRREGIGYAAGRLLGPALIACGLPRRAGAEVNLLSLQPTHAGAGGSDREWLAGRIVFVDRDRAGCVLHLIGRKFAPWLREDSPKYLSLKEMFKPLYGYALLDRRPSDEPVVVVESPPDAVTARGWEFDAVANVGTGMKEEHAALLARLRRPKVYVPHNDGGIGLSAAERWREKVGEGIILRLPEGVKDLNEMGVAPGGRDEFLQRMKAAGFACTRAAGTGEPRTKPRRSTSRFGDAAEEAAPMGDVQSASRGLLATRL